MKVCFVGMGSIAKRHIKNLRNLYRDLQVDVLHHKKTSDKSSEFDTYVNSQYYSVNDLPGDYDVIFITNPTYLHLESFKQVHDKGKYFFIEKPVFMDTDVDIEELQLREDSIYYVACPLRHKKVLQHIKNTVDFGKVYSIRCISSSYLPDWRVGQDYRNVYSAKKELGGGVELDLIHEWDYLTWLIGFPQKVKNIVGRKSSLEIDSNDIAVYIAEYEDKIVEVHLDYFGRVPLRMMELICEDDVIFVDLIGNSISFAKTGEHLCFEEERDDYQKRELKHFFDILSRKVANDNSIVNALEVLKLAKGE